MFKFSSICLVTGVLCAASGALAADRVKNQVIPNFATTDKTGWVLDRTLGVDDLLPPPTGVSRIRWWVRNVGSRCGCSRRYARSTSVR